MDEDRLRGVCQEYGIELVVLFGSRATGHAREGSDYDVGVLRQEGIIPAEDFLKLAYRLSQVLGMGNVDLVDLRRASPLLKYEATRAAQVLYEARPAAFNIFRVLAWKQYQDARHDIYRLLPVYIEDSLEVLLS
ncbi:MAG: nucleotidyltransferase domain-containing protein [Anaerolineae bacterium]|nr:nucleotidyltransferase domain-containing protein [Anaerolineae bacterium]